jgi:hypothetical protein
VQALGFAAAFLDHDTPIARQIPQLTERLGWDERRAHQPVLEQLRAPLRIGDIRLTARYILHVAGIDCERSRNPAGCASGNPAP